MTNPIRPKALKQDNIKGYSGLKPQKEKFDRLLKDTVLIKNNKGLEIENKNIQKGLKDIKNQKKEYLEQFKPAKHIETYGDGRVRMSGVRWGFKGTDIKEGGTPIFKETTVDPSKIKNVYLVNVPFFPEWIAGHALMYFEFEDGGVVSKDGQKTNGLVVSLEAHLEKGQKFGLIKGMRNQFTNIYQLGTWEDTVQKQCSNRNRKLIRHCLKLNKKQKEELLKNSLNDSFKDHSQDYYHTLNNSCFSNQVRLLNTVLSEDKKIKEWIVPGKIHNPKASMPKTGGLLLELKDLLDDSPRVITLPDKELYPDSQLSPSKLTKYVRELESKGQLKKFLKFLGAASGVTAGALLPAPISGMVMGGILGGMVGEKSSQVSKWIANYKLEPMEKYKNLFPR